MADYNCKLHWINQGEWIIYARNILLNRGKGSIIDDASLNNILSFDFKFEFIEQ